MHKANKQLIRLRLERQKAVAPIAGVHSVDFDLETQTVSAVAAVFEDGCRSTPSRRP